MISLFFGIVQQFGGAVLDAEVMVGGRPVLLAGARILTPSGQGETAAALAFSPGAQVAILVDDVTGAAVCLGGVAGDADAAPAAGEFRFKAKSINVQSGAVSISPSAPNDTISAAGRADKIAAALNKLSLAFNSHTHICVAPGSPSGTPGASTPPITAPNFDPAEVSAEALKIS